MALLDGKTAPATVIAMEESELGILSKADFDQHLFSNETIRHNILTMLCGRLREAWLMLKIMSFSSAEKRIMALLENLQEIYGVKDQRGTIINLKLTHSQIASYASLSRETVTRTLKKLEAEGQIIVSDKRIIIVK
jgi:CRP/FNR family transcriptional regulator